MQHCSHCGHLNPQGTSICEACYAPLTNTQGANDSPGLQNHPCPNCATPISLTTPYCGHCGLAIPGASPPEHPADCPARPARPDGSQPRRSQLRHPLIGPILALPNKTFPANSRATPHLNRNVNHGLNPRLNPSLSSPPQVNLLHLQTRFVWSFASERPVICFGKPNKKTPPDLSLAGLPNADVVSRIHAKIVYDQGQHFLEDSASSNGTHLNNKRLKSRQRYVLESGDLIGFGRRDLVTFLFRLS